MKDFYVRLEWSKKDLDKKVSNGQKEVHNWEFYTSGSHLKYITRNSAVYLQGDNTTKRQLKNEFDNSNISWSEFLNSKTKENNTNFKNTHSGLYRLFAEEPKDLDIEQELKEVSKISKDQAIWEMIINPGDLGRSSFLIDKNEWNEELNYALGNLLRANNLDKHNITGHWTIHTNTSHPHIHLSFWEKYPKHINKDGELVFKQKCNFSKKSPENFQHVLQSRLKNNKEYDELFKIKKETWDLRKEIRSLIAKPKRDYAMLNEISKVKEFYSDSKNKNYAIANDEVKNSIWKIFDYLKNNDEDFAKKCDEYNHYFKKLNNIKFDSSFVENQKLIFLEKEREEFDSQIGNLIVKFCISDEVKEIEEIKPNNDNQYESGWSIGYLLEKWKWDADRVWFKRKIQALKNYRKHLLEEIERQRQRY